MNITNFQQIDRKALVALFFFAFVIRYGWAYLSGVGNFSFPDWPRYNSQSDEILKGNFNLETQLFITAPLFSYVVAFCKLIFGASYAWFLEFLQISLSSLSVIFLALTADELFRSSRVTLLTAISFSIYPITLYWVHVFGQETFFQAFLIIGMSYLVKFLRNRDEITIIKASLFLSLTLLTKSHIQLVFPFLVLSIIVTSPNIKASIRPIGFMLLTVITLTMPYGIYNKLENGTYVISSSGGGGFFLTGHNEDAYAAIVEPPPLGSDEWRRLAAMDFRIYSELEPKLRDKTHAEKQAVYFQAGLEWSQKNLSKSVELAIINFKNYIQPGFHKGHQDPKLWLISFLLAAPVFALAYFEIIRSVRNDWLAHTEVASLFLTMLAFSVIFYSQNRFRVITIEPWYLMYACSGLVFLYERIKIKRLKYPEYKGDC